MHLAAYAGSLVSTAPLTDMSAIVDDNLYISNKHFVLSSPRTLLFVYANSVGMTVCEMITPSNRAISLPRILPISASLTPPANPNVADYTANPFTLPIEEELQFQASTATTTAENAYVIFGSTTGYQPAPQGKIYSFHGSSTSTANAGGWTTVTVEWDNTLPGGTYAVVGGQVISATGIAWRLIFDGQIERPGGLIQSAAGNRTWAGFYKGALGNWGTYTSTRFPNLQVLCNAADTAFDVVLEIIKVS